MSSATALVVYTKGKPKVKESQGPSSSDLIFDRVIKAAAAGFLNDCVFFDRTEKHILKFNAQRHFRHALQWVCDKTHANAREQLCEVRVDVCKME